MKVYLIYNGDQWLSTSSLNLVAVCDSKEKAEELMRQDIETYYGIVSSSSIPEEEYEEGETYMEDLWHDYEAIGQILTDEWGYMIRAEEMNTIL